MGPPLLHDLACVVHLHSLHSDGTGTVAEIAAAARRNSLDVVLLTDHDTLGARDAGDERWHGDVLVLVGEEVTPKGRDHYLAFGLEEPIDHTGMSSADICAAVEAAGGFGFAAHPFSRGSDLIDRARPMPFRDLESDGLRGIELWSFVNDSGERMRDWRDVGRFIVRPERYVDHAPERNLREWDRLCQARRVAAIGGLDAHQIGKRMFGRVPLRLMGYARSFRFLRTHVLCEEMVTGDVEHDRGQVYAALREGRCYLAMDSVAPARGFAFWATSGSSALRMGEEARAGDWTLHVSLPRPAELRVVKNAELVAVHEGVASLSVPASEPGVYRVEARLHAHGRPRTWIISNPIYLR